MRKIVSVLLALLLAATILPCAFAAEEEGPHPWAVAEVSEATEAGLVPETLQCDYREPMKRAEMAELIVRLLEKASGKSAEELIISPDDVPAFSDTEDKNVSVCAALGIIKGMGGGLFKPEGELTRAQAAAIINRTAVVLGVDTSNYPLGFEDTKHHWVKDELGWTVRNGILRGTGHGNFTPNAPVTREQAMIISLRTLKALTGVTYLRVSERWETDGVLRSFTEWEYDEAGNNVKESENGAVVLEIEYDIEGKAMKYEYSDGETYTLSYHDNGKIASRSVTNASGTKTYYYYSTGNASRITGADGAETSYKYSEDNGLLLRTGKTRSAEGDLRSTETAILTMNGTLLSETVETAFGEKETSTYEYDSEGRPTAWETVYGDISYAFTMSYNADGSPRTYTVKYRVNGKTRESTTVRNEWEYDENGNLTKLTQRVSGTYLNYVNVRTYEYKEIRTAVLPAYWSPVTVSATSY